MVCNSSTFTRSDNLNLDRLLDLGAVLGAMEILGVIPAGMGSRLMSPSGTVGFIGDNDVCAFSGRDRPSTSARPSAVTTPRHGFAGGLLGESVIRYDLFN